MESEVLVSNYCVVEGIFLRKVLVDLANFTQSCGGQPEVRGLTILYADNKPSITVSSEPGNYQRTKAWDIAHFWIKEKIRDQQFSLSYIPTKEMVADIFTKSLPRELHEKHLNSLGLTYTTIERK